MPSVHEDQSGGVTIAVAMLVRIQGQAPTQRDVDQWVRKIDAALAPVFGLDADTPVGITIMATEKSGKRIAKDLILDAAEDCPARFQHVHGEEPTRKVDLRRTTSIWTAVVLASGLVLLRKLFARN